MSFVASGELDEYFITNRLENLLFLGTAMEIATLVLLSQLLGHSRWPVMKAIPWFISVQSYALFLFAANFLLRGNLFPLVIVACMGIPAFIHFWQIHHRPPLEQIRLLYLACAFLAVAASSLLLAQYVSAERQFTLKMGLDLLIALSIMAMAVIDSMRQVIPYERGLRFKLVLVLSTIFACVMIAKSTMWHISAQKLAETLHHSTDSCVEITSADFPWLKNSPYTIINNWSLPSLALVMQDERPRKALLAETDCEVFYQSGMIQIDPWSQVPKEFLVPPLE